MQIGGFNLKKFHSIKKEVIDCLPAQNVNQPTVTFNKMVEIFNEHWGYTEISLVTISSSYARS